MNQSRISSFVESLANVFIGLAINLLANALILPFIGFHISLSQNLFIGLLYTAISVARSYVLRRFFNAMLHRAARRLAGEVL